MKSRFYATELEEMFDLRLRIPYSSLSGKFKDGITEKQKVALRHLHCNSTGITSKGMANNIIRFLSARVALGLPPLNKISNDYDFSTDLVVPEVVYRVRKTTNGKNSFSPEVFTSESAAEYYCAKMIRPEDDAEIINFRPWVINVVCYKKTKRYFSSVQNAEKFAELIVHNRRVQKEEVYVAILRRKGT